MPKKINNPLRVNDARDADFYPTPYWGTHALFQHYLLGAYPECQDWHVWEPAAGKGHMTSVIEKYVSRVMGTDKYDYGYDFKQHDFLTAPPLQGVDAIITNPPYNLAEDFVLRFLYHTNARIGCFLLRTLWLEGMGRYEKIFSKHPPNFLLFFSPRLGMCKGEINDEITKGSTMAFTWFIWDKAKSSDARSFGWIPPEAKKG